MGWIHLSWNICKYSNWVTGCHVGLTMVASPIHYGHIAHMMIKYWPHSSIFSSHSHKIHAGFLPPRNNFCSCSSRKPGSAPIQLPAKVKETGAKDAPPQSWIWGKKRKNHGTSSGFPPWEVVEHATSDIYTIYIKQYYIYIYIYI